MLAAATVVAFIGAAFAQNGEGKDDKAKLKGTWKLVKGSAGGKDFDQKVIDQGVTLKFEGDKVIASGGGKEEQMSFKVDATKKPKHIDFIPLKEGETKKTTRGIYEIEGDTLKILLPVMFKKGDDGKLVPIEGKRPESFEAKEGILYVLKKEKK
jgi:uncharacterized protein (TIGR03067 family)